MSASVKELTYPKEVDIHLKSTAAHLTGQDLLRITKLAEQAQAAVHISHGDWQVFLRVPEPRSRGVLENLRDMGYACVFFMGDTPGRPTFVLSKGGP